MNAHRIGYLIIFLFVSGQTYFAVLQNKILYTKVGPFYDSCSYLNVLSRIMETVQQEGLWKGLARIPGMDTVFLPHAIGAFLATFLPVDRMVGVVIQSIGLLLLAWSLFFYLYRCRRLSMGVATAFSISLISISGVYSLSGGLSDFRMDLSLYTYLALSMVWYLVSIHIHRKWVWILLGLSMGVTALIRSTSPVYLLLMMGPLLFLRLIFPYDETRKKFLMHVSLAVLVAGGLSLWYYLINFDHLYYYYFIWNQDANAHIPLSQSITHITYALKSIGPGLVIAGSVVCILQLIFAYRSENGKPKVRLRSILSRVDGKLLYMGLSPLIFLVFWGAGLNLFVSMPAAFGILLFLLMPLKSTTSPLRGWQGQTVLLWILMGSAFSMIHGLQPLIHPEVYIPNQRSAYDRIIQTLRQEISESRKSDITMDIPSVAYFNTSTFENALIYDYGFTPQKGKLTHGEITLRHSSQNVHPITETEWKRLGKTDAEVIHQIVSALHSLDFVLLPTDETLTNFEKYFYWSFVNRHIREIRNQLLAEGSWTRITDAISVSPYESHILYRNDRHFLKKQ